MQQTVEQLQAENQQLKARLVSMEPKTIYGVKQRHPLLDHVRAAHGLRSDRALAELIGMEPPFISRVRAGKLRV